MHANDKGTDQSGQPLCCLLWGSIRPEFLLVDLRDFFSDLGSGWRKKSSENGQLTGHFQSFFNLKKKQ